MAITWNERTIGRAVFYQLLDRKCIVVCPNSYFTGFEADLLGVTDDLRLIDIEIKVSRSDLKADIHKDKWWKAEYTPWVSGQRPPEPKLERRDHPVKIWKHYYVLPKEIWVDELFANIPETSGVILLSEGYSDQFPIRMDVKRRSKPNRKATQIKVEDAIYIARLVNCRFWGVPT